MTILTYPSEADHLAQSQSPQPRANRRVGLRPAVRAGRVGASFSLLMIVLNHVSPLGQASLVYQALFIVPAFMVICLATGLLAANYATRPHLTTRQGLELGWMAGFWQGIYVALIAMSLAASSLLLVDFGQDVARYFAPVWHPRLTPDLIALIARVAGAMVSYGLIGSLISGLISAMGGMVYAQARVTA